MKGKSSGELNGFLDSGAVFKGELEFEDTMRIDGRFNGKIVSKNELIVGESATIEAIFTSDGSPSAELSSEKSSPRNASRSTATERSTAISTRRLW